MDAREVEDDYNVEIILGYVVGVVKIFFYDTRLYERCDGDVLHPQGFLYRPDGPNRRGLVPVYRSGSVGNQ
jgi:hypothetical protein